MTQEAARPDRTLAVILSVIAAIVVIAIVVVFTRGGPTDIDPSTPEGVVQSYSRAMVASDFETARSFVSAGVLDECDEADRNPLQGLRMTVISTTIDGTTAVVKVSLEQGSGSFGGSSYSYDDLFTLVDEGGDWKISTTPWELTYCYDQGFRG
ncbi:hypothetical protein V6245_05335 [Salinibacterium amurskyense]|uniref:hypothetical protein n=1 Tax=Salinibacterium amurskyense TaxID=205941 RepID=UPI003120473A